MAPKKKKPLVSSDDFEYISRRQIGMNIRKIREAKGVSQSELAREANMKAPYVSGVEKARRNVSLVNLLKICYALRVPLSDIAEGIDFETIPEALKVLGRE